MTRSSDGTSASGFTLIELLVVLVIVGLMAASLPSLGRLQGQLQARAATRQIVSDLRLLRDEAVRGQTVTSLVWGSPTNHYRLEPSNVARTLPPGVSMGFVPEEPRLTGEVAGMEFFPDGSSSGGVLTVSSKGSRSGIRISWLSGEVTADGG